jgi:hypothetical protein
MQQDSTVSSKAIVHVRLILHSLNIFSYFIRKYTAVVMFMILDLLPITPQECGRKCTYIVS